MLPCKLSEHNFENVTIRGLFSKSCKNCSQNFHVLWLQSTITTQWLQIAGNSLPNDPSMGSLVFIFRSTLQKSRPNKDGLECPSVRLVCLSFYDFNEIWHVGRGWWVMHDGMQYDLIQGQGHEPFKVGNPAIFESYCLRHLQREVQLTTDS